MASFHEQIDAVVRPICYDVEANGFLREMDPWLGSDASVVGNTSYTNPDIHTTNVVIDCDHSEPISDMPSSDQPLSCEIIQVSGAWVYGYNPNAGPISSPITNEQNLFSIILDLCL
ncbi:hypothetical protein BGZ54_009998 [Gamsiella multidivaricata]|nr:hypothetical protein BGZ54_009998 [Gamsiella multidivaricata]